MGEDTTATEELHDLLFTAIEHAIESIKSAGGPLVPFSITEDRSGERALTRHVAEQLEEGVMLGRKQIGDSREQFVRYALAWDGRVTFEGKKWDAVIVEAGDKECPTGLLVWQRYTPRKILRGIRLVGNAAHFDSPPSRLR